MNGAVRRYEFFHVLVDCRQLHQVCNFLEDRDLKKLMNVSKQVFTKVIQVRASVATQIQGDVTYLWSLLGAEKYGKENPLEECKNLLALFKIDSLFLRKEESVLKKMISRQLLKISKEFVKDLLSNPKTFSDTISLLVRLTGIETGMIIDYLVEFKEYKKAFEYFQQLPCTLNSVGSRYSDYQLTVIIYGCMKEKLFTQAYKYIKYLYSLSDRDLHIAFIVADLIEIKNFTLADEYAGAISLEATTVSREMAQLNIAEGRVDDGQIAKALTYCKHLNSRFVDMLRTHIQCFYMERGDLLNALTYADSDQGFYNVAVKYWARGDYISALSSFNRCSDLFLRDSHKMQLRARCYANTGKYDLALIKAQEIVEDNHRNHAIYDVCKIMVEKGEDLAIISAYAANISSASLQKAVVRLMDAVEELEK